MFSKKFWAWCGVVCLVLWGALIAYGYVNTWRVARGMVRDNPGVALSPQPLPDPVAADLNGGATVALFGYKMKVPWSKVVIEKSYESSISLIFADGARIIVFNPAMPTTVSTARGETPDTRAMMATLYGSREVGSNYRFTAATMFETGSDISLFQPRMRNVRATMLLVGKMTHEATAIYSLSIGSFRGFQLEERKGMGIVELLLFDDYDRELQLWIVPPKSGASLTQEQINGIVASIQPPA